MVHYSKSDFKRWGRQGGRKRARVISPSRRSAIAVQAARSRWAKESNGVPPMPSVRLLTPNWDDPVYLEEALSDGGLVEWTELYRRVREHPFGPTADALVQVLSFAQIYGVLPLWRGLLRNLRGENA